MRDYWLPTTLFVVPLIVLFVLIGVVIQSWNDDSIKCLQSGGFLHSSGFLALGHECLNAENFHVIGVVK